MRKRRRERQELETGVTASPVEPRRITPMDIQQKEFRLALRGYNEREVDEFLDALTEELARFQSENVRLRAEVENREREARAAQAEAEATLRRAREEATRMLEDAELQAQSLRTEVPEGSPSLAEGGPGVGSFLKKNSMVQAIRPFLGREREFLQSMARLIQEHADSVREEVRQIREVPPGAAGPDEGTGQAPESDRTALPAETVPEMSSKESPAPKVVPASPEPEIPRRPRKRAAEPDPNGSAEMTAAMSETGSADDRRAARRDAEDGRRRKSREASVPTAAPAPAPAGRGPAADEVWPEPSEGSPTDVFRPKRRVARPPVSRLEDNVSSKTRPFDEAAEQDLPMTQPFEPLRFDERAIGGDPPLEGREGGDEDERSLRELFWGEE